MEIEAKFTITAAQTYLRLMQATRLGDFTLDAPVCKAMHDTYLDSMDHIVAQAGYALRRRLLLDGVKMTLKGTQASTGIVHRREEIELTLAEVLPLDALPESPFRTKLVEIIGDTPVETLCVIEQQRCFRMVQRHGVDIAEMALDQVTLHAGARTFPLLELEVELKGEGTEADLTAMIEALTTYDGLVPQGCSKLERALALVPPTQPETIVYNAPLAPGITVNDTMAEAARKTLRYHLGVMLENEAGTFIGEDIEALHDMRVATRRMRAALRVFDGWIPDAIYAHTLEGLKRTGRRLGTVRDLDVFRQHAEVWQIENTVTGDEMRTLSGMWNTAYSQARTAMMDYLESDKYRAFVIAYIEDTTKPWAIPDAPTVAETAPVLIQSRIDAVMAYADLSTAADAPLTRYHALRIEMKRLRYTLEFLREILGGDIESAILQLKAIQDHLGTLQDAVVASTHLDSVLTWGTWIPPRAPYALWQPHPTDDATVRAYTTTRSVEIETLITAFPDAWQRFASEEFSTLIDSALPAGQDL